MQNKKIILYTVLAISIILNITLILFGNQLFNTEVKQILYFQSLESQIQGKVDIYNYYNLAIENYDKKNYELVIKYCELSRKESSDYSQELRELISKYPNNELFNKKKECLEKYIDSSFAMYEACEYLESASRSYIARNYDMAGNNIDEHNIKIKLHDELLEEFYNLSEEYKRMEDEILK